MPTSTQHILGFPGVEGIQCVSQAAGSLKVTEKALCKILLDGCRGGSLLKFITLEVIFKKFIEVGSSQVISQASVFRRKCLLLHQANIQGNIKID